MWDLKPNAPTEIRGEFKSIATSADGVQICEHLSKTAKVCDRVTLVRSLNHTIPSHGPATVFMQTGNKPTPAVQYPVLGSLTTRLMSQQQGVPPFVSFGESRNGNAAGYLGTAYNPFVIEGDGGKAGKGGKANFRVRGIQLPTGFTLDELEDRNKLLNDFDGAFRAADKSGDLVDGLDAFHKKALEILRSDKTKKAFDLTQEKQELRDAYGANGFGQGALAARRLVEAGARVVTVAYGFWDTHGGNFTKLKGSLLPQFDAALSSLLTDLSDRGMLERTLVVAMGEFGRSPKVNAQAGRDHWNFCYGLLMAGGGLKGGYVHGASDKIGARPSQQPVTPADVIATIYESLGIPPDLELVDRQSRPFVLAPWGAPIREVVA